MIDSSATILSLSDVAAGKLREITAGLASPAVISRSLPAATSLRLRMVALLSIIRKRPPWDEGGREQAGKSYGVRRFSTSTPSKSVAGVGRGDRAAVTCP